MNTKSKTEDKLHIEYVPIEKLRPAEYNPRKHTKDMAEQLKQSIKIFGAVDPLIVNSAPKRSNVVIGGHFRLEVMKEMGFKEAPVVKVHIPDSEKERELNVRLNKNVGEFDLGLLAEFDESFLANVGFSSEEIDEIFPADEHPEEFDLQKEFQKLQIEKVQVQKGDRYQLGDHVVMCGDSTNKEDILKLMNGVKADLCLTDPPYILDYLKGKKKRGSAVTGFGYKRDRRYLETESLPDDFTAKWMASVHAVQKDDFHIICYENWKNLRTIWGEMEKYWKVKNMIVWHLKNRSQGFAGRHKLFSKHDIAMVGASQEDPKLNLEPEGELLDNEYETALYAISGKPSWEGYQKGKRICPTDHIEFVASDEKNSGQGIIFGCKPTEILIPYIKVLTKRNDVILEPFGGSGSTLIAAEKMKRRCFLMEKSPVYTEVIKKRWERLTGKHVEKLSS